MRQVNSNFFIFVYLRLRLIILLFTEFQFRSSNTILFNGRLLFCIVLNFFGETTILKLNMIP